MLRWFLGFAFASVAASIALGYAFWIQQAFEGPAAGMMDLTEPGPLFKYVIVTSAVTILPVMLVGSLTDSALVRLRRQELWAYALAGLIVGAFIGWFLSLTPQSDDDERSIVAKVWPLALFGLTASSTFWWVVRRKSQSNSGNLGGM